MRRSMSGSMSVMTIGRSYIVSVGWLTLVNDGMGKDG